MEKMTRKIEKMQELFGTMPGKKCKDCDHLWKVQKRGTRCFKCDVYGDTSSEATDWRMKWDACGLWNKDYKGDIPIVRLNAGGAKKPDEQIEGQMMFL